MDIVLETTHRVTVRAIVVILGIHITCIEIHVVGVIRRIPSRRPIVTVRTLIVQATIVLVTSKCFSDYLICIHKNIYVYLLLLAFVPENHWIIYWLSIQWIISVAYSGQIFIYYSIYFHQLYSSISRKYFFSITSNIEKEYLFSLKNSNILLLHFIGNFV